MRPGFFVEPAGPQRGYDIAMMRQVELVDRVRAYDPSADEDALNRAYVFAMKAHGSQKRESGDPYFSHPLEVAGILTNYHLDTASIITALLHDTLEDTDATSAQIAELFGEEVAQLVDGVTKLTQLELQSDRAKQAENFRKLLLAMSRDIRVLLVKLADRLHNMRTLEHVGSEERRLRVARETMDIYAPLAERIGMHDIKDELEDRAFREINGEARDSISRRLGFLRAEGEDVVEKVVRELRDVLAEAGIEADVAGREKSPYSIWRKMQRQQSSLEQLSDIIAFRVIVSNVPKCYQALGVVHSRYPVVPGRFKDYISTPKPNGYRSLHTSVLGLADQRIEIQIRTREMHDVAERGVAAHWIYKDVGSGPGSSALKAETDQYRWLQELLEILDNASSVLFFAQGGRVFIAAGRDANRFCLCGAYRNRRSGGRGEDQRPQPPAADGPAEWRSGRNSDIEEPNPVAGLGKAGDHRQGARTHSPGLARGSDAPVCRSGPKHH